MVASAPANPGVARDCALSNRERDVLVLLAQRLTDKEIAAALSVSPRTVMLHVANILAKLGATNRREAAAIAVLHGLVEGPMITIAPHRLAADV